MSNTGVAVSLVITTSRIIAREGAKSFGGKWREGGCEQPALNAMDLSVGGYTHLKTNTLLNVYASNCSAPRPFSVVPAEVIAGVLVSNRLSKINLKEVGRC